MPPPTKRAGQLEELTEEEILDILTQRCRAALAEEGVPERIRRRGWGKYSLEILVQAYDVKHVDVGILAHHRGANT